MHLLIIARFAAVHEMNTCRGIPGVHRVSSSKISELIKTLLSRVILKKLIVAQLVKNFPAFMETEDSLQCSHDSPPVDPVLRHMKSVKTFPHYLSKFIIILSTQLSLGLSTCLFP
jgi:hypothetical protein